MGRFGENKVSCHTLGRMSTMTLRTVRPVLRPYVCFEVFRENLIFSTRLPNLQTHS
jgi:hypothetical protein